MREGAEAGSGGKARLLESWIVPLLFGLVVASWGTAVGLEKIRSFDYWWHLRTGELIVSTGAVPRVDPYSYTVPGARWIDLHWLFQIGLYGVHALGGDEAVRLAKGLLVLAVLSAAAAVGWRRERAAMTGLAVVLLALVGSSRFMARPDLLSFLLLIGVLALLLRHERRGGWALFAVVPLQLLWANVHGLFAVGLALIAMALAAELLRPLVEPGAGLRRRHVARLAAVLLLSGLASLVNPNGLAGALFPLEQLGMIGSRASRGLFGLAINELQPSLGLGPVALAPAVALLALIVAGFALRRRHVSTFDVLVLVGFVYLGLSARRNLALFAVVSVPLVTRHLGAAWAEIAPARRAVAATALLAALATAGVLFAADRLARAWDREGASSAALLPIQYPEAAVDWIAREAPPQPLFHCMADGGYLIARLFPRDRVMVDGRLEVYGAREFARLEVEGRTIPGFQALDAEYHFGTVLLQHVFFPDEVLFAWLAHDPGWRLVQLDDVAAVFVREATARARGWPAVDPDAPDLFAPLDPEARPALDLFRRRARIRLLAALGRYHRALDLAEDTLTRHPAPDVEALRDWLRARLTPGRPPAP